MSQVQGIEFATVYVDDYEKALAFYQKHFGYEVLHPMSDTSSWGKVGDAGLYIEGKNEPAAVSDKSTRASIVFNVKSSLTFFKELKDAGVEIIQEEAVNMGEHYWFQFKDPAGNILEALGHE